MKLELVRFEITRSLNVFVYDLVNFTIELEIKIDSSSLNIKLFTCS